MIAYRLTEEQRIMQRLARDFAQKEIAPIAAETDEKEEFPREVYNKMAKLGFSGILVPQEYGGIGSTHVTFAIVMEELSKASAPIGGCIVPHTGQQRIIYKYGTEEQKKNFIVPLARGERLGAFSLTEPNAGSDAASLQTRALLQGNHYIFNGTKCFVTNGGEAEQYLVIARTDPNAKRAAGLSAFVVEKGTPGFIFGKKERKMGFRANITRELIFQDCPVPKKNLIGKEGEGLREAMELLDYAKMTAGAGSVGIAQAALDAAVEYAKQRVQFGRPIAAFQGIQFMLADMAILIEATRALTYNVADMIDKNIPAAKEAAITKVFATDMAMKVTTDVVQIFGGYGYMKDYPVERYMRDAKIGQIYDGTNQIHRAFIARQLLA